MREVIITSILLGLHQKNHIPTFVEVTWEKLEGGGRGRGGAFWPPILNRVNKSENDFTILHTLLLVHLKRNLFHCY